MASMILDSSPPEATMPRGFTLSPGFVEIMNSASSNPPAVKWLKRLNSMENSTSMKFKSVSPALIFAVSSFAAAFLISDSCPQSTSSLLSVSSSSCSVLCFKAS